ncbi:MAG: hypothetical protein U0794_13855 [Isosphaeraceae bacterium]
MTWFPRNRRNRRAKGKNPKLAVQRHSSTPTVVELLENRTLLAFTGVVNVARTLAVWTGDATGNNLQIDSAVTIDPITLLPIVALRHNNQANFNSVFDFDSSVAGDQILPAGVGQEFSVSVTGGGNDTIQFGTGAVGVDQLLGTKLTVTALGNDALDQIITQFSNNPVNLTYNGNTLVGTGGTNVDFTTANFAGGFRIQTGTAADVVAVLATEAGDPLTIADAGGGDTTNIGNSGSVQGILGNVTTDAELINVDDSQDATARTTTVTGTTVTGLAPATITYSNATTGITVQTGTGATNVVNIQSTTAGQPFSLIGHGATNVNIGNAGSVQSILGTVNLSNPPSFSAVVIDDSADATARTINVFNNSVTGIAPAAINYTPATPARSPSRRARIATSSTSSVSPAFRHTRSTGTTETTATRSRSAVSVRTLAAPTTTAAATTTSRLTSRQAARSTPSTFNIDGGGVLPGGRNQVFINTNTVGDGPRFVGLAYTAAAAAWT